MTILDEILEHKRIEVDDARSRREPTRLALEARACSRAPSGFRDALQSTRGVSVIAEIKRRSPSKGLIREDFDAVRVARAYADAGAACISVLTDQHFFGGSLDDLARVRAAVDTPLLRKDFVIDEFQIDEARVVGADAVLLIVAAVDDNDLKAFHGHAKTLGLDVLVEVHDDEELQRALAIGSDLIGVNNRDLRTFVVDLSTTERIAARIADPNIVLVAESGISTVEDVARLERAGATGFLVGESLMRQPDPGEALKTLRGSS
jgi:indole-3-glycerol phosphate synthase